MYQSIKKIFLLISLFIIVFFYSVLGTVNAQLKNNSPLENINSTKSASENINLNNIMQKDTYPVGNTIDANVYLVGPNDILSILITPLEMQSQMVAITSDCSILHPRFGAVNVSGLTLQQVSDTLTYIFNQRKEGAKVLVALVQARKVFINIRGNVISPGTYSLPATYSVSTAIKFANQLQISTGVNSEEQSTLLKLQESRKERERIFLKSGISESSLYSNRNIKVIRKAGASIVADVERALATKNHIYDPFICEGDEIIVPYEDMDCPTISIAGEVIRPATVAYKNGDMASQLIKMGCGFTENADLDNIFLYCENNEIKKLTVDSVGNLLGPDISLDNSYAIIVGRKSKKAVSTSGIVSIRGEVNKPNIYIIEKGKTKLRDVVEMAGGFTPFAHLPLAYVGRRDNLYNDRVSTKRSYKEYFQHSDLTMQDTMRFAIEMDLKIPKVACDFVSAFNKNSEEDNIYLQDGDVIEVPRKPMKVNVFGQVNKPGFIDFKENQSMEWYITQAGGYAASAAKERARIIRGTNKVWENGFKESIYVQDGDEVFVPSPRDIPPEMELQKWAAIGGLAGFAMTFISVFWGIYKDLRK